jgi:iron complex outermembrane receptor protein
MSMNLKLRRCVIASLGLSAASFYTVSQAQESPLAEVIVTGSRIASPNLESISPVAAISSEQIRTTGRVRIEDIINQMPQALADQGASISNGATGTATVDLRGLGSQRTLVLVNGRRLMPGDPDGSSAADLNNIPLALIERVDVLTGGASSVYGADAVAGVVNFVMDTKFEGIRIEANYSGFQHDNDNRYIQRVVSDSGFALPGGSFRGGYARDFSFAMGVGGEDSPGHATFYATYRNIDPVLQGAIDYSACTLNSGDVFSCGGSGTTDPAHIFVDVATPVCTSLNGCIVGPGGVLREYDGATDAYNFGPLNYYQRPDERYTAGVFLNYETSETSEVYAELMYMNDRSVAQIAPSGAFFPAVELNCDNPLLSPSQVANFCTAAGLGPDDFATIYPGRRNTEGGGRQDDIEHSSFRVVAGLRGDLGENWSYDAYFQHGRTERSSTYLNDFSIVRIGRALQVRVDDRMEDGEPVDPETFGTPQCVAYLEGIDPNCVPWNIWTPGGVTPEALAYLQTPGIIRAQHTQRIAHADVTGDLSNFVKLPTATTGLNINVGAEWRDEETEFQPDLQFSTGDLAGQGGATLPTHGGYDVLEGFIEARLPLVEDKPGVQSLSVEGGYRYSDYSVGFKTDTYKFGLDWAPIDALRFRGSYQRAVRAPNVGELFSPQTVLLDGTTDPCDGTPEATLEQCLLTGMTPEQYGNVPENPAAQYNGLLGGSQSLRPEKSDTISFGLIFQPDFLPGLMVSLDYFDIDIEDAISDLEGGNADAYITQCVQTGDPTFCSRIHRDSLGSLWIQPTGYIEDTSANTGTLGVKGIDTQTTYRFNIGDHGIHLDLVGTWLSEAKTELVAGLGEFDCVGLFGGTCGVPLPEWRHSLRTTWTTPWLGTSIALTWRYLGSVDVETSDPNPQLAGEVPATDAKLGSRSYFDLTASLTFLDDYTLRIGANNLLDKEPPLVGQDSCPDLICNGNTFAQLYDVLGRQWFVSLTARF